MGSGSSTKLSETVKANSISQEFNRNHNSKNKQRYQRFSYCSIASDTSHQLTNQPSIYDNHIKQINSNLNNKYYKFPDVATSSSNINTILLPNRFKSFENFIAPNQMHQLQKQKQQQQQQQATMSKQTTPETFESHNNKLTKSLIMYDVDFEKFNRCNDSTNKLDKLRVAQTNSNNRSFKTMNVSSSIYHDLIELDKDLAKRESDLKQQTNTSNRISCSSSSESSSGCSSGASSSNLSVSRRKSTSTLKKNNDSSIYSVNTQTQCSTFKSGITTINSNKRDNKKSNNQDILRLPSTESQSNLSSKASPLLTSASSTSTTSSCSNKSILSTSANLSSSCSSISSPITQYFSPNTISYNKQNQIKESHHHNHKRAQNRRGLLNKTKSECLFNHLNSANSSQSSRDDTKESIYSRNFPTVAENLNQEQLDSATLASDEKKLKKLSKTNRDSGIIVDLFHLNGSMTNLKTKFNNAKINLRNSFSVFNLKHSSTSSSLASKKSLKKRDLLSHISTNNNNTHNNNVTSSQIETKEINNVNDLDELNHNNTTVSSASYSSSAATTPDDENINNNNEILKQHNSRENFFSSNNNNNNNKSSTSTKFKLNTISSSINNFLSNLTINNTNTSSNNNSSGIIKNSIINNNENCFTSSTNLVLNKNNDTLSSNNNKQINYKVEPNCANTLSLSSTNLTASNNNNETNYKLTRFSNSVKINDNKKQQQELHSNQQIIKRTMTFHSTNTNSTKREAVKSSATVAANVAATATVTSSSSANEIINSLKPIKANASVLNSSNSTSFTNNNNSIKLVNSKTISSFKSKTDHLIPVISFEKRSKPDKLPTSQEQNQMKHSVSMGGASTTTDETQQINKQLASHRHQKIVVQASTSDLLNCFSVYISEKCCHLLKETYVNPLTYMNNDIGKRIKFEPRDTINWLRSADRALLIQGWQEIAFMNPVNVVFVYLLVRDTLNDVHVKSVYELQCYIMACLYLAFSYMGNEISYPLKPFLIEENREIFWQRIVDLMNKLSPCMLKINRDPRFFTELFYELKSYSIIKKSEPIKILSPTTAIQHSNLINNSCYKQLTDQINSIEIKIDSFNKSNNNKHHNDDENNKFKIKTSHDNNIKTFSNNLNKSLVQLNESTRVRNPSNNENQNPFNSYCI